MYQCQICEHCEEKHFDECPFCEAHECENVLSDDAKVLLSLIDGSHDGKRGLRSYPHSTKVEARIHDDCLELQAAGKIYQRGGVATDGDRGGATFYRWTACGL